MKERLAQLRERWEDWRDQRLENESLDGGSPLLSRGSRWFLLVPTLFVLYFCGGAVVFSDVQDDAEYQIPERELIAGGSQTVSMVSALINREVNEVGWEPQNPWFFPTALLDNMPNFQQGMIRAIGRFSFELTDQLGRVRGSSIADKDLQRVAGELQIAPNIWTFDGSLIPTESSASHYKKGLAALRRYNKRLAQGQATFDRRADNLLATLDRIASDLGSSSAAIDQYVVSSGGAFYDTKADDLFYDVKGQSYAYYMILRELGVDFKEIIHEKGLTASWNNMLSSLHEVAGMSPISVQNGPTDSYLFPNHLLNQGFFLIRARTQMREVSDVLIK